MPYLAKHSTGHTVALFGGSFDPPHRAHVQIVEYLLRQDDCDEVWVLPSFRHPQKQTEASFEQRLAMCQLAFQDLGPKVQISDWEKQSSGFTVGLLEQLHQRFPEHRWILVLGSDLRTQISSWKEPERMQKLAELRFLPRSVDASGIFSPEQSREIRQKIRSGQSIRDLVPAAVENFIYEHSLYE